MTLLEPLVLICGGHNTRLAALQGSIYKPFLELQGTTIVAKYIERARREGVERVLVVTDEQDGLVSRLLARIREVVPTMTIDEFQSAGSIGSKVATAADSISASKVFVALGDTYAWYSFADLADRTGADFDSAIVVAPHSSRFGIVTTREGAVVSFDEKPVSEDLINLGQLILGPHALELLRAGAAMEETLSRLAETSELGYLRASRHEFMTLDTISDVMAADTFVGKYGWD